MKRRRPLQFEYLPLAMHRMRDYEDLYRRIKCLGLPERLLVRPERCPKPRSWGRGHHNDIMDSKLPEEGCTSPWEPPRNGTNLAVSQEFVHPCWWNIQQWSLFLLHAISASVWLQGCFPLFSMGLWPPLIVEFCCPWYNRMDGHV